MGERAGYRVAEITRSGKRVESWVARKQWYLGGSKAELEKWVKDVARVLMSTSASGLLGKAQINDGSVALRHDLGIGRLYHALIQATLGSGFESLHPTIQCDIDDHGLFEIEMIKWNEWAINHYKTCRKKTKKEFEADKAKAAKTKPKVKDATPYVSEFVWGELQPKCKLGTVEFANGKGLDDGTTFKWSKSFKEY